MGAPLWYAALGYAPLPGLSLRRAYCTGQGRPSYPEPPLSQPTETMRAATPLTPRPTWGTSGPGPKLLARRPDMLVLVPSIASLQGRAARVARRRVIYIPSSGQ